MAITGKPMKLETLYGYIEKIGVMSFSTLYRGEVHSRSAHFNGFDEDGLYFRTMVNKPYGRQLMNTGKLTVCGISNSQVSDEGGNPIFPRENRDSAQSTPQRASNSSRPWMWASAFRPENLGRSYRVGG